MGSKKTKQTSAPGYATEVQQLAATLANFLGREGTEESPYYSDIRRMWEQTAGAAPYQLPSYLTGAMEQAVTTGLPTTTPLTETEYYKGTYPAFKKGLLEDVLPGVKESFGARGALRTSDYASAATEAATGALEDYILSAATQAYGLEEAARQRQMAAMPTALTAAAEPAAILSQLAEAAQTAEATQYPLLQAMLALIGTGAGAQQKTYAYPGEQITGGISCCFIFIEGEGEITERVRFVRDRILLPILGIRLKLGYRRMASKLVPMMRRSKTIKSFVRAVMTQPLSKFSEWRMLHKGGGFVFYPLACFWVSVWYKLGGKKCFSF